MVQKIDVELARIAKLGCTPKIIEVGDDLYELLQDEQSLLLIAPVVSPGETTHCSSDKEVTAYQGITLIRLRDVPHDHLEILY